MRLRLFREVPGYVCVTAEEMNEKGILGYQILALFCYIKSILYPLTWAPADCILTSRRGFELCTKMGTSHLWFIDRDGRVFLFNLRDKSWRHISTPKLGSRNCFKRVSAVEQCAWAISASQQPYLFVHSTELPIRVKVQTYENQRWGIYGGWKATEKSVRPSLLFYD